MNAPNFPAVLAAFRELNDAESERTERLRELQAGVASAYRRLSGSSDFDLRYARWRRAEYDEYLEAQAEVSEAEDALAAFMAIKQ